MDVGWSSHGWENKDYGTHFDFIIVTQDPAGILLVSSVEMGADP